MKELAIAVFTIVMFFATGLQFALAAGFPLGKFAWGGKYHVLPSGLKLASFGAAIFLLLSLVIVLNRAEIIDLGINEGIINIYPVILAGYLALNTLTNLASKSKLERIFGSVMSGTGFLSLVIILLTAQ